MQPPKAGTPAFQFQLQTSAKWSGQFTVNAQSWHVGIAVPVRTCLTTEVVMNTPWPMLGFVHALHGEIQALRERIEVLEANLAPIPRIPTNRHPATAERAIGQSFLA